jgi:hypothetical protein
MCLFRSNIFIGFRIIKEMPGLVGGGTPYTNAHTKYAYGQLKMFRNYFWQNIIHLIKIKWT